MIKKGFAALLLVLLVFSLTPVGFAGSRFPDVPDTAWYKNDMDYIINDSRKILVGYGDGLYHPNDTLKVAEFIKCVIVARGFSLENGKDYWAKPVIDKAIELGYVRPEEFMSNDAQDPYKYYKTPIARGEMSKIVGRAVADITGDYAYRDEMLVMQKINDFNTIYLNERSWVLKCFDIGILTGYSDGSFKSEKILTRAEATAVIHRLIDVSARRPADLTGIQPRPSSTPLPIVMNLPEPTPVPVESLNRPESQYLGNGIEVVEGVRYDPAKDMDNFGGPTKTLGYDKLEDFVTVFLDHLWFYEYKGEVRMKGYLPRLPEGYMWCGSIDIEYKGPNICDYYGYSYLMDIFDNRDIYTGHFLLQGQTFDKSVGTNLENIKWISLILQVKSPRGKKSGQIAFDWPEMKIYCNSLGSGNSYNYHLEGLFEWLKE